jgi:cell division protein FtsI/penicillin-binding protein 2
MGPGVVIIDRIRRVVTRRGARNAGAREPASDWRATMRRRTLVAAALLGVWAGGIEARLVSLQIYRHGDLVARAARQQMRTIVAPAKRGDILDRHGRVLATSVDADSIYAVPSEISNPGEAAARLCDAFGDCTEKERQALTERLGQSRAFAYVRRQVPPDQARRVAALNLDGLGFIKESRRFYPNRELAAHLLGWVGIDNGGLSGLEFAYDSQIRGKPARSSSTPTRGATPSAASNGRRHRGRASNSRSTSICNTSPSGSFMQASPRTARRAAA